MSGKANLASGKTANSTGEGSKLYRKGLTGRGETGEEVLHGDTDEQKEEGEGDEGGDLVFANVSVYSGAEDEEVYTADVYVSKGRIERIVRSDDLSSGFRTNKPSKTDLTALETGEKDEKDGQERHAADIPSPLPPPWSIDKVVQRIDCSGLTLCPGFIDLHAHSDLYLLTKPDHLPKVSQGVTTEVIGQDGLSYAPIKTSDQLLSIRTQISGWNGNPSTEEIEQLKARGLEGLFEWTDVDGFLGCLEKNGTAVNVAMLVPQGNLRLIACGPYDTSATFDQLEEQKQLLRESMEQGAIGMSSGLTYTPGMYASTAELGALCCVLKEEFEGSYYAPHHRSYGRGALEAYEEMLNLGESTGCPIHLTHATLNFPENRDKAIQLVSMIDAHLENGLDVTLDSYPYLPGCTTLSALLPSWATSGGPRETSRRLEDPTTREKIRVEMEDVGCDGSHGIPIDWSMIQIGTCTHPSLSAYSGQRVSRVAEEKLVPPIEVYFQILRLENLATSCLMHIGNEENVREMMRHRVHCGGSDAILHGTSLHPRAWGTFPRFIGHYARDLGLMSLREMIAHLTSRPAKRIGVYPERGYLGVNSFADLVLFDPGRIRDASTFEEPIKRSEGVVMVLVNGCVVYRDGKGTGSRPGKVLRRGKDGKVG